MSGDCFNDFESALLVMDAPCLVNGVVAKLTCFCCFFTDIPPFLLVLLFVVPRLPLRLEISPSARRRRCCVSFPIVLGVLVVRLLLSEARDLVARRAVVACSLLE